MAVKVYHSGDLDQYVAECDRLGGIGHPIPTEHEGLRATGPRDRIDGGDRG